MSTQPTQVTTAIEHLDFTPALPCEHSWHGRGGIHSGPARFILDAGCPACPDRVSLLICESGWAGSRTLHCDDCGAVGPRDSFWRIVGVIGGAS